ncbi:MAG: GntR family transcriptional regulator [Clostridia bacterium]|nr:GntR family transcriptional regulator [Clostridia bacterium]
MTINKTLSEQIHDSILEMVIDAGGSSEELLLTEGDLVERFGVSKAPVREALLRLCSEEVLKSIPRCGYVVVQLGEKSGRENLEVRKLLELTSLDRYFNRFTEDKLDEIGRRLTASREQYGQEATVWQIWQANLEFHCDLISVSDNRYLVKHLKNCIGVEQRYYAQNHFRREGKFNVHFTPEAHENILKMIRKGNKEKALKLLDCDIGDGRTI